MKPINLLRHSGQLFLYRLTIIIRGSGAYTRSGTADKLYLKKGQKKFAKESFGTRGHVEHAMLVTVITRIHNLESEKKTGIWLTQRSLSLITQVHNQRSRRKTSNFDGPRGSRNHGCRSSFRDYLMQAASEQNPLTQIAKMYWSRSR